MSLDQQTNPIASEAEPGPGPDTSMSGGQWLRLAGVVGLLVLLTVTTGVYGLIMVLGLVVMIFLHELGHFVMAKRAGMKVTEFFLGFGPRVWSFHRGETEYGLKLIPAGAYVKIIGMHDIEDVDPADEAHTYRQKPFWARFGVAVAGSTMHFLLALVLIFVLLAGFGLPGGSLTDPDLTRWRVEGVSDGTAADAAGLRDGDDVVAIDGIAIGTFDDLRDRVSARPDRDVTLTIERDGRRFDVDTRLGHRTIDGEETGFLGVGQSFPAERASAVAAVPATFEEFGRVAVATVKGMGSVFSPSGIADFGRQVTTAHDDPVPADDPPERTEGSSSSSSSSSASADEGSEENRLSSLLGVFRIGVDLGDSSGLAGLAVLFVFINVFIGIFNLTPLLPFDGGHVVIAVYEKVQEWRKGMKERYFADVAKLLPMTYAVVVVLGLIFVSTLYLDILKPVSVN